MENVSFSYGDTPIIENASFSVPQFELMTIIGPNGGGKTTLLKLILGLLEPLRGTISVLGKNVNAARARIGYMPQHIDFDSKFPISTLEVVLMGLSDTRTFGWYRTKERNEASIALKEIGLSGLESVPFADLSGGQRQRVLMARAIVSRPEILLLDEPTSNIDAETEERFRDILLRLNKRMTILMVSHDLGFVSDFVKTVICVNKRVLLHPTHALTGEMIHGVYQDDMRAVRHDFHHVNNCTGTTNPPAADDNSK